MLKVCLGFSLVLPVRNYFEALVELGLGLQVGETCTCGLCDTAGHPAPSSKCFWQMPLMFPTETNSRLQAGREKGKRICGPLLGMLNKIQPSQILFSVNLGHLFIGLLKRGQR